MIAIPAVDLRGGRCVQLVGGRPEDERVSQAVRDEISVSLHGSIEFVPTESLEAALAGSALAVDEAQGVVDSYADGQLVALRKGLFVGAAIVGVALVIARRIPDMSFDELAASSAGRDAIQP